MSDPSGMRTALPAHDVLTAAGVEAGVPTAGAALIRDGVNVLYRLPGDIVARIGPAGSYNTAAHLVRVSHWLASTDVPAVRVLDGVHQPTMVEDRPVTWWVALPEHRHATPAELGAALKRVHALAVPDAPTLLAIGSRLARGARVVRGPKREFISRCYNLILRGTLATRFTDAQCGFKAIRADVARRLLPHVEDTGWFFDTELLVLAERAGARIHEVPVDWVDDPDSRVDIVSTAVADLKGVARVARGLVTGRIPIGELRAQLGRAPLEPQTPGVPAGLFRQLVRFAAVGVISTLAYLLLFVSLRGGLGAQGANLVALLLTAIANTAANRRFTFGVRGRRGAGRHQFEGLLVFGLGLALTSGSLALLHVFAAPGGPAELVAVVGANLLATVLRFLLLRNWVFRPKRTPEAGS